MGKYLSKIVKTAILNTGYTIVEFSSQSKISKDDLNSLLQSNKEWSLENLTKFISFCKENNLGNYTFDYLITDNHGKLSEKDFDCDRFTIGLNGPSKLLFLNRIKNFYNQFLKEFNLTENYKSPEIIIYNKDHFGLFLKDPFVRDVLGNPISEKPITDENKYDYHPNFQIIYKDDNLSQITDKKKIAEFSLETTYENTLFESSFEIIINALKIGNLKILNAIKSGKLKIEGGTVSNYLFSRKSFLKEFQKTNKFDVFVQRYLSYRNDNRDQSLYEIKFLYDFGVFNLEVYDFWFLKVKELGGQLKLNQFLLYLLTFFEIPNLNDQSFLNADQLMLLDLGFMDNKKTFDFLNKNYKLINLLLNHGAYIPLENGNINFLKTEQLKDLVTKRV